MPQVFLCLPLESFHHRNWSRTASGWWTPCAAVCLTQPSKPELQPGFTRGLLSFNKFQAWPRSRSKSGTLTASCGVLNSVMQNSAWHLYFGESLLEPCSVATRLKPLWSLLCPFTIVQHACLLITFQKKRKKTHILFANTKHFIFCCRRLLIWSSVAPSADRQVTDLHQIMQQCHFQREVLINQMSLYSRVRE